MFEKAAGIELSVGSIVLLIRMSSIQVHNFDIHCTMLDHVTLGDTFCVHEW